jgi:photosystem II stability/assembly factor-like uncharacterized protein
MKIQWHIMHRTGLLLMFICGLFAAFNPAFAQTWTQTSAPYENWSCVASSADGTKLVAVAFHQTSSPDAGMIYTSTNSGTTWITNDVPNEHWFSVASSADGTKLVAASGDGQIYTSTNAGIMWMSNNVPVESWTSVSSSADGTKFVALAVTNVVYTSTNSGSTWTSNNVPISVQAVALVRFLGGWHQIGDSWRSWPGFYLDKFRSKLDGGDQLADCVLAGNCLIGRRKQISNCGLY